jgi:transcriptional regulator with XRE-family HTH domain
MMSLMSDDRTSPRGRLREHVAEEIRVLLARKRISAAELARRTGIKQSTMSRRMTGETAFDMDDLEVIAEVLGVEVGELMPRSIRADGGVNTPYPQAGRTDEPSFTPTAAIRPIGGGRRGATRPPSAPRANKIRPGNARPAVLPRAF